MATMLPRRQSLPTASRLDRAYRATSLGLAAAAVAAALAAGTAMLATPTPATAFPQPSFAPVAWELDFENRTPARIEVGGEAYWYLPYTVTNNTDEARLFLPDVEMVTREGDVLRAGDNIPLSVFNAIKGRVRSLPLIPPQEVAGRILVGRDQAKSSVAIWREPTTEMGTFDIYVGGLSGEVVRLTDREGNELTDADGVPILVRKTKRLTYRVRGDDIADGRDSIARVREEWVMR